jgi:hypothetical protein
MYSTSRRVYTVETGEMKSDLMFHVIFGFEDCPILFWCWVDSCPIRFRWWVDSYKRDDRIPSSYNSIFRGHAFQIFIRHAWASKECVGYDLVLFSNVGPVDRDNKLIAFEHHPQFMVDFQEFRERR